MSRILIVGDLGGLEAGIVALLVEHGHNTVLINEHSVYNVPPATTGESLLVEGQSRTQRLTAAIQKVCVELPAPPAMHWRERREAQWKREVTRYRRGK